MKIPIQALVAGTFLLLAAQVFGQTSGVSHPEDLNDPIIVVAPQPAVVTVTPAPALRMRPAETVVTITPAIPVERAEVVPPVIRTEPVDPADAGIVAAVPSFRNSLSEGTLVKARLSQLLSSRTTSVGTHFTAQVTTDILHEGQVLIPAGAMLHGRITAVHGGHRIGGAASIHLEPETVILRDGSEYRLNARVIDLEQYRNHRVNAEGTILRSDHAKATLAALGLTTGSAAAAGAVIGGGPGAAIGAGVGAGIGAVWWLKRDREETLAEGTQIIFSLDRPMNLTPAVPINQ